MKILPIFFLAFVFAGCFSARVASEPKVEEILNLDKAIAKFPGYSAADYHSGKMLYETKCNACHALKDPLKFTEEQLTKTVPEMVKMSNDNKGTTLSSDDQTAIYRYMVSQGL